MKLKRILICAIIFNLFTITEAAAQGAILPVIYKDIAGLRPVIIYRINGKKATCMIHSNAHLFLNMNYQNAQHFGIENLAEDGEYGIIKPGKVGKAYTGNFQTLNFGNITNTNASVSVFETYPPDKKGFGMLGLDWISQNRIILDFITNTVIIQPDQNQRDSLAKQLKAEDYFPIPMQKNKDIFMVNLTVNEQTAPFVVSTVSELTFESTFA